MRAELPGPTDFDGFRQVARALLAQHAAPESVQWVVCGAPSADLFDAGVAGAAALGSAASTGVGSRNAADPRVPATFIALCREVLLHRDPQRFGMLYRLLWRLQQQPALRDDPLDADWLALRHMAQAVRRDLHKMKAFVRFSELAEPGFDTPLHVAWFEPQHHIVEAAAPFFIKRFAGMRWAVLTPQCSARWDGERLRVAGAATRSERPPPDAGEALWLTYYRSIFNPSRLKLRMMQKEMPQRYWHNLPEAQLISGLAAQAMPRQQAMLQCGPSAARASARHLPSAGMRTTALPLPAANASAAERLRAWQQLRDAAASCRDCPLGARATQTVWGEGPIGAALMLVGEQPGDQEDLRGRAFVGPSGQLLDRALAQLGWERSVLYVSNAVKHFKYEPRGKRRMHKTPAQREADACEHWLRDEIALVQPQALIALGATAARQLLGKAVAVMRERGRWLRRDDGRPVLITLHPSALLRGPADERDRAFADWLADLDRATSYARALSDKPAGARTA